MNIKNNWKMIQRIFEDDRSSWHKTVCTVNPDGYPHCAPIGAFFLRDDLTAYFFDSFLTQTAENLVSDKRVCVLAVNSDFAYWKNSLVNGKFEVPPSVRLYGKAVDKRRADKEELQKWHDTIAFFKGTPGYDKLWKDMKMIWNIEFSSFKPTYLPDDMIDNKWSCQKKTILEKFYM